MSAVNKKKEQRLRYSIRIPVIGLEYLWVGRIKRKLLRKVVNCQNELWYRMWAGRLFHTRGAWTERPVSKALNFPHCSENGGPPPLSLSRSHTHTHTTPPPPPSPYYYHHSMWFNSAYHFALSFKCRVQKLWSSRGCRSGCTQSSENQMEVMKEKSQSIQPENFKKTANNGVTFWKPSLTLSTPPLKFSLHCRFPRSAWRSKSFVVYICIDFTSGGDSCDLNARQTPPIRCQLEPHLIGADRLLAVRTKLQRPLGVRLQCFFVCTPPPPPQLKA